ncbi:MAG: hypothetical protein V2A34_10860, partial [Lentisphaerota bacterium]
MTFSSFLTAFPLPVNEVYSNIVKRFSKSVKTCVFGPHKFCSWSQPVPDVAFLYRIENWRLGCLQKGGYLDDPLNGQALDACRAHFTSAGLSPNPNRNPNPNLNPLMLKPCRVDYARQASL